MLDEYLFSPDSQFLLSLELMHVAVSLVYFQQLAYLSWSEMSFN